MSNPKDWILSYLGEKINIHPSTRKFYIKSPNNDPLFVSKNLDTTTKVSQNNEDLIYDSKIHKDLLIKVIILRTRIDSQVRYVADLFS